MAPRLPRSCMPLDMPIHCSPFPELFLKGAVKKCFLFAADTAVKIENEMISGPVDMLQWVKNFFADENLVSCEKLFEWLVVHSPLSTCSICGMYSESDSDPDKSYINRYRSTSLRPEDSQPAGARPQPIWVHSPKCIAALHGIVI